MKVLLIDDHTLFRTGIGALLQGHDIQIAAAVGTGEEGIRLATELEPDIVLLDLRMPEMDGLQVLAALKKRTPTLPVVMLTTSEEEQDLLAALRGGAQGYLLKDMETEELISSLERALKGEVVVAPSMTPLLARVAQGEILKTHQRDDLQALLTPREYQILSHLAEGQSNKVIGRELDISDGTVKLHVKSILKKLDVHSRVEAAVIAVERGITKQDR
ncbi:MAG: response regulator [Gammaproteobacteria bacterium]|jgi:two-component system nitrate/nitrite response regulator NarL|nr:response regulator [Gammaproteobacteria bacterium]MBT4605899.1 response regulator [Thiotrichales bacterium]MBT3473202.1 response regulator [Gammaproteobacteria bacterium]MBT3967643.1 response regulator [Gammaproteobacteria bacterium]MBT4081077.1 response regulator [Gammaproteobacteria bacterium]